MASYNFAGEPIFQLLAGVPILLLGLYVYKSNPKDLVNRVFGLLCAVWTAWIVAVNLVLMSGDADTADLWNRFYVYAQIAWLPVLIHFALVFPYRSKLLKHRWLAPAIYVGGLIALGLAAARAELVILTPIFIERLGTWSPNYRTSLLFAISATLTFAVLFFLVRYIVMDLDVTRKRLFFVTFALATFAIYNAMQDIILDGSDEFHASFRGEDQNFWQLTLAADFLLVIAYFGLLVLLALRAKVRERRRDALILIAAGVAALVTGVYDLVIRDYYAAWYPGTLWLWRLFATGLVFYAILRYQLFDLHVRVRIGVRYGTMTTVFAAVFFTVQELVKDLGGSALGYFSGLISAAALVFLFSPLQRLIERFSHRVVPATSTENYERYRSMEIYRAALEGALADHVVSTAELQSLRNLRGKLGVSDADHALLERDIRTQRETRA